MIFPPINVLVSKLIKHKRYYFFILPLFICAGLCACEKSAPPPPKKQSPEIVWTHQGITAYEHARVLTECAPRHGNYPGHQTTLDYISRQLSDSGISYRVDSWRHETPEGETTFSNIIVEITGHTADKFIILGSHFDTKPGIQCPGANDGASSTGVLLELIRTYAQTTPEVSLRFVFFDGEECYFRYDDFDGLWGSKRYANQIAHEKNHCVGMILIDMIGDADLTFTLSPNTHPFWIQPLKDALKKWNHSSKFSFSHTNILDDHVPFAELGIPTIDLIDFNYGPANMYWHSPNDTMDKLSPESLKLTGQIVIEMIRNAPL